MKRELLQLFPTPVLVSRYSGNLEKERKYIESINYMMQPSNHNFRSNDTYLFDRTVMDTLKAFVDESLQIFSDQILLSRQKLVVTQCWANRNPKNTSHHEHLHPNSIVSGVFYLNSSKEAPPIKFSKSVMGMLKPETSGFNNFNSESYSLPIQSGDLVLFPSHFRHSVPTNTSDDERVSLAFNTFFDGPMGSQESLDHLHLGVDRPSSNL